MLFVNCFQIDENTHYVIYLFDQNIRFRSEYFSPCISNELVYSARPKLGDLILDKGRSLLLLCLLFYVPLEIISLI